MGKQRERRFFTPAESAQIWDRWQRGQELKLIAPRVGHGKPVLDWRTLKVRHLKRQGD